MSSLIKAAMSVITLATVVVQGYRLRCPGERYLKPYFKAGEISLERYEQGRFRRDTSISHCVYKPAYGEYFFDCTACFYTNNGGAFYMDTLDISCPRRSSYPSEQVWTSSHYEKSIFVNYEPCFQSTLSTCEAENQVDCSRIPDQFNPSRMRTPATGTCCKQGEICSFPNNDDNSRCDNSYGYCCQSSY
eukprot:Awhi_evm1s15080